MKQKWMDGFIRLIVLGFICVKSITRLFER